MKLFASTSSDRQGGVPSIFGVPGPRPHNRGSFKTSAILVMMLALAAPAFAQIDSSEDPVAVVDRIAAEFDRRNQSAELQAQAVASFDDGDFEQAQKLFEKQAEIDPTNFTVHYNLACVRARRDDPDEAWDHLLGAIKTGFVDAHQLQRDPSLASMQRDPRVVALIENWDKVIASHRTANLESAQRWIGQRAEHRTLDALRIELLSNHDSHATDAAERELELVASFARTLMPRLDDADESALDPWIVVALPDKQKFLTWSISTFGPAARKNFSQIGGAYDHDAKRLIAMDLGSTLRHEFFHVLQWRDMSRRGVVCPIWVQEGLASLVEDCDTRGGRMVPVPSWRTNIAKRLEKAGKLPPIAELTELTHERFATNRPLRQYALARTFFLYLLDRGVLVDWYERLMQNHNDDPSGMAALQDLLHQTPDELHAAYRKWVRDLPMVPETSDDLDVTLGIRLETGQGEGPVVLGFTDQAARRESGLRTRDVITAIDGQSVRDLQELIRVLGQARPGQVVTLSYRRGKIYADATITLRTRE